jgi:hypothetical protein
MVDTSVTDEAMVRMYEKAFTAYVCKQFTGEPEFNIDSPTQMARLMYEILKLPVRIANKLTDVQRAAGKTTGNPKTDDLAVQNALHFDGNDSNAVPARSSTTALTGRSLTGGTACCTLVQTNVPQ